MPSNKTTKTDSAVRKYETATRSLRLVTYVSVIIGVMAIILSIASIFIATNAANNVHYVGNATLNTTPGAPLPGKTLAGIDQPLNASQLAVINNAPDQYFETAGMMYLNGSLANPVYPAPANKVHAFYVGNKTSIVYLGSITCIFCGENRWAMALALSRFGNFSSLYQGYSSLGDGDIPTLYWTQVNYNSSGDAIGNYYSSPYINFVSIEDLHPIAGGFNLNTPSQIGTNIAGTGNQTYVDAFARILNLSSNKTTAFQGTPYTIWGNYQFNGADAIVFGNTTPVGTPQLSLETHAQVFSQLSIPNDQFSWSEYAAADIYVAATCESLSNATRASVSACSLPAIKMIMASKFA